jgi:hypothetical protein
VQVQMQGQGNRTMLEGKSVNEDMREDGRYERVVCVETVCECVVLWFMGREV